MHRGGNNCVVRMRAPAAWCAAIALLAVAWAPLASAADGPDATCEPAVGEHVSHPRSEGETLGRPQLLPRDPADVALDGTVKVSPTLIELPRAVTSDRYTSFITIRNRRPTKTTFTITAAGVRGTTAAGRSVTIVDPSDPRYACSAAPNLTIAGAPRAQITLPPRGVARVRVTYAPGEAGRPAADTFGAVVVAVAPQTLAADSTQVAVQGRVLVPVIVTGSGARRHKLVLTNVTAPWYATHSSTWTMTARIRNRGTSFERPVGTATVKTFWGSVVTRLPVRGRPMLPGAATDTHVSWRGLPWIGVYEIDTVVRGQGAKTGAAHDSRWLLVLPPWWMFAVVLTVIIVIWSARRRRTNALLDEHVPDEHS